VPPPLCAWVLAQTSNPGIARKALRRLALHALFCEQVAQASAGIGFEIAPDLWFGQTTWRLTTGEYEQRPTRLQIPADLMLPTRLDAAEQTFWSETTAMCWPQCGSM